MFFDCESNIYIQLKILRIQEKNQLFIVFFFSFWNLDCFFIIIWYLIILFCIVVVFCVFNFFFSQGVSFLEVFLIYVLCRVVLDIRIQDISQGFNKFLLVDGAEMSCLLFRVYFLLSRGEGSMRGQLWFCYFFFLVRNVFG